MNHDTAERALTEMLRSVWDLLALIGIFTTILVTIGYSWGYFE